MSHDGASASGGGGAASVSAGAARDRPEGGSGGNAPGAGRRILVIEDEPNISEAIRFILRRDGWEVAIHCHGTGAVEKIAATGPALVILDVMLPGASGFDILRTLRAQRGTAALPVILLTAKGSAQMREQATAAGASMFIGKPFANAELLAAVRQLVGV